MRLDHNTYRSNGKLESFVSLHHNVIIRHNHENGEVTLDACGWRTKTTCDRIHRFNPYGFKCYRKNGKVYVSTPLELVELDRSMTFSADGRLVRFAAMMTPWEKAREDV